MASEEGLAAFVKCKFHMYLNLEKDQMERILVLPFFQETGTKETEPFFSIPDRRAFKIHTWKGPEFPVTGDKVAPVRMPTVLLFSLTSAIKAVSLPVREDGSPSWVLEIYLYSPLEIDW